MEIAGMRLTHQKTPGPGNIPSVTNNGKILGFSTNSTNTKKGSTTLSREPRFGQYKTWQKVTGKFLGPGSYHDQHSFNNLSRQPTASIMKKPSVYQDGPLSGSQGFVMQGDMIKLEPNFIERTIKKRETALNQDFDMFDNDHLAPQSVQAFSHYYSTMASKEHSVRVYQTERLKTRAYSQRRRKSKSKNRQSYSKKKSLEAADRQISFSYMPQREFLSNKDEIESISKISAKMKKNSGQMSSYSTKAEDLSNHSPMQTSSIPTKLSKSKKKKLQQSADMRNSIASSNKRARSSKNREDLQSWSTIQPYNK